MHAQLCDPPLSFLGFMLGGGAVTLVAYRSGFLESNVPFAYLAYAFGGKKLALVGFHNHLALMRW